jgi:hypothetical protein
MRVLLLRALIHSSSTVLQSSRRIEALVMRLKFSVCFQDYPFTSSCVDLTFIAMVWLTIFRVLIVQQEWFITKWKYSCLNLSNAKYSKSEYTSSDEEMSKELGQEIMTKYFPNCPLCHSQPNYSSSPAGTVVQCESCKAKFFSKDLQNPSKELKTLRLFSLVLDIEATGNSRADAILPSAKKAWNGILWVIGAHWRSKVGYIWLHIRKYDSRSATGVQSSIYSCIVPRKHNFSETSHMQTLGIGWFQS